LLASVPARRHHCIKMALYLLFESAAGYALFLKKEFEDTAEAQEEVQQSMLEHRTFAKIVSLASWTPFKNAEEALEQVNAISAGQATESLLNFLELNLPKKKKQYQLGVYDPELGKELSARFSIAHGQSVKELLRGCRAHFSKLVKDLSELDLEKARLVLGTASAATGCSSIPIVRTSPLSIRLLSSTTWTRISTLSQCVSGNGMLGTSLSCTR